MSMSEVVARCCRPSRRDLVEEDDVEEVVEQMLISRCGCGGSLLVCRGASGMTMALLPCQKMVPKFSQKGVPSWGCI